MTEGSFTIGSEDDIHFIEFEKVHNDRRNEIEYLVTFDEDSFFIMTHDADLGRLSINERVSYLVTEIEEDIAASIEAYVYT